MVKVSIFDKTNDVLIVNACKTQGNNQKFILGDVFSQLFHPFLPPPLHFFPFSLPFAHLRVALKSSK